MIKGLLGTGMDDPRTRANLAMAMGLLEAGGPSLRPTSLGQTIGRAGAMGVQAYDAALKAQQAKKLEDLQFKTAEANLAKLGTEAAEARRRSQIMGQIAIAKPSALPSLYAQLDPTAAAKAAFERSGKPPETKQIYDPTSRTMRLKAFNPATKRYDIDYGPAGAPEKPQTITAGGVTGIIGQDVFGRSTFIPIPGAPVTPQTPTFVQTGVENMPGATQQNIPVADPTAPGGFRMVPVGPVKLPKPTTGTVTSIDESGNITITSGVPSADVAKPTVKAIEAQILETQNVLSSLDQIDQLFDPSYLTIPTQLENYVSLSMEKLTGVPPQDAQGLMDYSRFRSQTQELFSTILKQLSGAAVTKFELDNARLFLPDVNDSPTQFRAKLAQFRSTTSAALYRAQQLRSGNDKITDNLAQKYPLSLQTQGGQTMYIDDFVQQWMGSPDNVGKTQADALQVWADSAAARRQT